MQQISASDFIEENLKTIFAYSLSKVSDKTDAEDLTNEIVLAILKSAGRIKNPNAFYGYVWKIASNTCCKFIRRKTRVSFCEINSDISDGYDFTEELFAHEDISNLRREIALLSKEYRECTVAYYYDGLSCSDISDKLNISLEMVKYYLFKTRKILKEGICMEREFGEKSFKPEPFEFHTIFSEKCNSEYCSLFARKLPGQILMSAYYAPISIRELSVELGVASVYLEDEIMLLEKYNLISKVSSGKYQTKLVIFTDDYMKELYGKAEKSAVSAMAEILKSVKGKLLKIREINDICGKLSDSRILWAVLWPVMRLGYGKMKDEYSELNERITLYSGASGINYGVSGSGQREELECGTFAGYSGIDENYYASAADFGILPKNNRYFFSMDYAALKDKIYNTVSGKIIPEFMILTKTEEELLFKLLSAESLMMSKLYRELFLLACQIMYMHAPKRVYDVDRIVFQTLFFQTLGFIGYCAVKSGELRLPDFDGAAAVYIRENTEEEENAVSQEILI